VPVLCLYTQTLMLAATVHVQVAMDGFPAVPTVLAVDPVQSLLAVGAPGGRIKVYPPQRARVSLCVALGMVGWVIE
jgi:hypothetical protein